MKTVLTFGVFDFFHLGHLRLFKNIRKMVGEPCRLVVAVQAEECIHKYKPGAEILYSDAERREILESVKEVDEIAAYTFSDETIDKMDFDVFAISVDQHANPSFQRCLVWCEQNGKQVITIPYTDGICSSKIKKGL
ncbi:MAG: adenylyltransferase/cytidyltransferase family protein [Alphaproteobacteria bacterium]|nr:adenylyltransferase/cytidyltransferase family protein [Alphaproteobacteria bacterium]